MIFKHTCSEHRCRNGLFSAVYLRLVDPLVSVWPYPAGQPAAGQTQTRTPGSRGSQISEWCCNMQANNMTKNIEDFTLFWKVDDLTTGNVKRWKCREFCFREGSTTLYERLHGNRYRSNIRKYGYQLINQVVDCVKQNTRGSEFMRWRPSLSSSWSMILLDCLSFIHFGSVPHTHTQIGSFVTM